MLFFIDESGHDHGEAPYEVLAAVAVSERDLWNLIQAVRAFVLRVLELCASYRAKAFAAMVNTKAPRPMGPNLLRRDYAFLFQRFY
jgi:hypothetical protein